MAYYLAIETKFDKTYEAINIKKTEMGRQLFTNDTFECTLEEIDRFTTHYDSITQLGHNLHSENKIPWRYCSLAIVYINGTEIRINKNILYSKSNRYLQNPELIREYIINAYTQSNTDFFKKILLTIAEDNPIKYMIETAIKNIEISIIYNKIPSTMDILPLADELVYKTDESGKQVIPHEYDYRKIHDILALITNYENELEEKKNSQHTRKKEKPQ